MQQEPIVIVGAGPVGLTVAEILTQQNIPVIVLEQSATPSREWRASTFHAATLELLEATGLSEELLARGLIADKIQYRDRRTGVFAEFDTRLLQNDTKYPFRLQCPQSTYVQILAERLRKRPLADLRFNSTLLELEQDGEGVKAIVQTPEGQYALRAPFLLGADGAKSIVRKQLGIPFDGMTFEERLLLVGTPVPFDQFLPDITYVNYISDPEEFLFILRVPEAWRLLYAVPATISDEQALSDQRIQGTLCRALRTEHYFPIVEHMIYRFHQRVAERFYAGRVVLLGDAAHINSPFGGLGLNSGIHDAVDLSMRLIRIRADQSVDIEAELQTYARRRRQVAIQYVQNISGRNTRLIAEQNPQERLRLQQEMANEANDAERARQWLLRSSLLTSVREQGIGVAP
ncbi:MAG TPA: NAD(P)/FAD-dependent oxidoreductase [Ktedonobacteraceae bacterium]|nr:NAD(P)/FAD-dependent oxidoreductase [Ktedonobacteraceae bacterium]